MSASRRTRVLVAPLLLSLVALMSAACAPEPTPTGIFFYPPSVSYVNHLYTPTATSSNNLPVSFALDATSTGCSYIGGVLNFEAVGTCVVNASQVGDATNPAFPTVQRKISIYNCPVLRSGIWTGPLGLSANVVVDGASFTGTVDLTSQGFGVQTFAGLVTCEVVNMTFNSTPLTGTLSYDGKVLSSSYNGLDIVLNAPA